MNQDRKLGGRTPLRTFVHDGSDLVDTVFAVSEGGRKLDTGLAARVAEYGAGEIRAEVTRGPSARFRGLRAQLAGAEEARARSGRPPPDLVLLSLQRDLSDPAPSDPAEPLAELLTWIRSRWESHVVVLNASSVDPADDAHRYHGVADPLALRVHRANLALVKASVRTGISILDADRILAELGGAKHVTAPFDYSAEAHARLQDELLRIVADIGFFEARPLLPQVGRS